MTARDEALANVAEAKRWVGSAIGAINVITGFNGKRSEIESLSQFRAQKTHFHVTLGPAPSILDQLFSLLPFTGEADPALALLVDIRTSYFDIAAALGKASSIFVDAPVGGGDEDVGRAPAFVPQKRDGTLRITPLYSDVGPLVKVHCLIHESAHFIGDAFQDYAYRDRTGEEDQNKYRNLPVQFAIRNADSYAYFALQMAKNIDRVLGRDE